MQEYNFKQLNDLSREIISAAIEVHKTLGPGLLEGTYEAALVYELNLRGLKVENQISIPINYKGVTLDKGYRADVIVNDTIILELKASEGNKDIFYKQLLTYLRLSKKPLGLLINFNNKSLKEGLTRIVNGYF